MTPTHAISADEARRLLREDKCRKRRLFRVFCWAFVMALMARALWDLVRP